ncbi:MAG: DNA recombination protein RmuC [Alphaproteobacteria bacterium]|nr:DNA recombination protein RmuC [Alphaproteobacteria bacterium]
MSTIYLLTACLIIILVSFFCVFFSQRYQLKQLKEKNYELAEIERQYQAVLLENSKLQERCSLHHELIEKYNELQQKYSQLEQEKIILSTNLEQERKNLQEKLKLIENAEQKLTDTFKAISSDTLSKNNSTFLDLAKSVFEKLHEKAKSEFSSSTKSMNELVTPIKSALENVDSKLTELEKSRVGAYEALKQQINDMIQAQNSLKTETSHLVSALKTPTVRGRWGEMQLRRVVELAGMIEHCDFEEQQTISNSNSEKDYRPDMIIYLPGDHHIIVDAKAPLSAYLEALETNDDRLRKEFLEKHAQQIRKHVSVLAGKKYWMQFDKSPEFVIMFLPGEVFFSVATQYDMNLIEFAMQQRVIISTPTILLALLHAIAQGWRQENLAENAKQIIKMGQELYQRLSIMADHVAQLGRNINSAVQSYNSTVASLESRVLVSARKFKDLEIHEKNIVELNPIETNARLIINNK